MAKITSHRADQLRTLEKPNGRGIYHVTAVVAMRQPSCDKMDESYDDAGSLVLTPHNTKLQAVIAGKLVSIPCTFEVFQEALQNRYGMRSDLNHFLYQKVKAGKNGARELEPVSLVSTVHDVTTLGAVVPSREEDYAMRVQVNSKDGSVIITNLHFKIPAEKAVALASGLAAAKKLEVGTPLPGNAGFQITDIAPSSTKHLYELEIRSVDADRELRHLQQHGVSVGGKRVI